MCDTRNLRAANDHYLRRCADLERTVAELRNRIRDLERETAVPATEMRVIECHGCGRTTTCVPVTDPLDRTTMRRTWCSQECLEAEAEAYWMRRYGWAERWDHR